MIYLAILLLVWFVGGLYLELHDRHTRLHHPVRWSLRSHGLISLSDRQRRIANWLWPLITVAVLIVLGFIHTAEWIGRYCIKSKGEGN